MKVLNYTTAFFALLLLFIIPLWAGLFYYSVLDEIYDSIDDGLDNQKGLIIKKAAVDSSILNKNEFDESHYTIKEISSSQAMSYHDTYVDTLMYMQNEQDFEPVRMLRTVFNQNSRYYQMEIVTSMVEEDDLVSTLLRALIWLYLGLVTSILILNNILLKRIWQPFYHLLKGLKNFRLEKSPEIDFQKTRITEFSMLNETIRKLLQKNIDAYTSQKHFIENASHELQTPLAISINKLEALAETQPLSEEQLTLLSGAIDNLEKLTRLNKALLLISRIENKQFDPELMISMNELVKKLMDDFQDQASYQSLSISCKEEGELVVKMNPDLAAVLVTNLLKNAVVHSPTQGKILIKISKSRLEIHNSGKGNALNGENLFKRFHTEQSSSNSIGLGLSIVKSISDLYNITLSYQYNLGHSFSLQWKK